MGRALDLQGHARKAVTLNGEIVKTQVVIGEAGSLPGDVDGNGVVNGSDVTALYNLLLNQ